MAYAFTKSTFLRPLACMALFVALAACGAPPPATGINDPNERRNRAVHEFNKGLDTVLVRPASQVYGVVVPEPARGVVSNFAENLGLPSAILNNTLQGDLPSAAQNSGRFIVNSVVGIGGLFDPAGELGVEAIDTDFGETLHVWGAGEGTYV
ncbi:MAG: MlaA family lipoprotein, partial [Pseudomonadota bacterium]